MDASNPLKRLADQSSDQILIVDPTAQEFRYTNRAFESFWGDYFESDRDIFVQFLQTVHPGDRSRIKQVINEPESGHEFDFRLHHPQTGDLHWFRDQVILLRDPDGSLRSLGAIRRDITTLKQTERALRDRSEDLRTLNDRIPGVVFEFRHLPDGSYDVDYMTEDIESLTGIDYERIHEDFERAIEALHPEDRDRIMQAIERSERNMTPFDEEHRYQHPDGTVYWARTTSVPEPLPGGGVRWRGLILDITEKKKVQRALENSRDLLSHTETMASTGGWTYTQSEGFRWTDGAREIVEVPPGYEPSLRKTLRFLHPDDRSAYRDLFERCLETGQPFNREMRVITAENNTRWIRARAKAIRRGGEVIGVRGAIQDVTERRELESKLREEKRKVEKLARTDPLTELANRREIGNRLEDEMNRARRHDRSLSFAILDLDGFKQINDQHGHPAGDEVLRSTAGCLENQTRSEDLPGRFGGDEFAILFPETNLRQARDVLTRILEELRGQQFHREGGSFGITASVGVAELQTPDNGRQQLIQRSDQHLYRAKQQGGDRLVPTDSTGD